MGYEILLNNKFREVIKDDPCDYLEIEIGDIKQIDFYPQCKLMRWDNEVNLSVRLVDDSGKEAKISEKDAVVKWETSKVDSKFYEHSISEEYPEGGLEFEVILKEKPSSNKLQFSIQTKGLDFFYQPPLTQKEIDEGHVRPENVVGSYAVYHSTKNGNYSQIGGKNYRAGKAFHIFRPKVTDANGKFIWAELFIDVNKEILEISIDQNFLDSSIYPLIIDPTFGYGGEGGTAWEAGADIVVGSLFTSPSNILKAINLIIYCKVSSGTGSMKGLLVLHNTLNILTNGIGDAIAMDAAAAWKTTSFSTYPTLSINTGYLLMGINNSPWGTFYYDAGDVYQGHYDISNSYTSPVDLGSISHEDKKFSIYCTYLAAYSFSIGAGSYTIAGQDVGLLKGSKITLGAGSYSITGFDANLFLVTYVSFDELITFTDTFYFRKSLLIYSLQSTIVTTYDIHGPVTKIITLDSKIS